MRNIKLFLAGLVVVAANLYAGPMDEALLAIAKLNGNTVYATCIATPPVSAAQQATCASLYKTYIASLTAVNSPLPLVISLDPDPYISSHYDICKYETGHMLFDAPLVQPYCPTI